MQHLPGVDAGSLLSPCPTPPCCESPAVGTSRAEGAVCAKLGQNRARWRCLESPESCEGQLARLAMQTSGGDVRLVSAKSPRARTPAKASPARTHSTGACWCLPDVVDVVTRSFVVRSARAVWTSEIGPARRPQKYWRTLGLRRRARRTQRFLEDDPLVRPPSWRTATVAPRLPCPYLGQRQSRRSHHFPNPPAYAIPTPYSPQIRPLLPRQHPPAAVPSGPPQRAPSRAAAHPPTRHLRCAAQPQPTDRTQTPSPQFSPSLPTNSDRC